MMQWRVWIKTVLLCLGLFLGSAAQAQESNLIVMGSYGYNPVLEVVLGSAVDQVLRSSQHPTLICR